MSLNVEFAGLSHWYNMNCLEFVIILLPVPKVNKLRVPIFLKIKRDFTTCAADFSLLNLPKGKSLGRSKPATNS